MLFGNGLRVVNPLLHKPEFKQPWNREILKTPEEKVKILVISIFSFSLNVFYTIKGGNHHVSNIKIFGLQMLSLWSSQEFGIWKNVKSRIVCWQMNSISYDRIRILDPSKPKALTHYQTTNFRLFQTQRVCRRQFQIWRKWQKVIQMGRKHCEKRRNCSSRAISPFPTVFSKGLFPRGVKKGRKGLNEKAKFSVTLQVFFLKVNEI